MYYLIDTITHDKLLSLVEQYYNHPDIENIVVLYIPLNMRGTDSHIVIPPSLRPGTNQIIVESIDALGESEFIEYFKYKQPGLVTLKTYNIVLPDIYKKNEDPISHSNIVRVVRRSLAPNHNYKILQNENFVLIRSSFIVTHHTSEYYLHIEVKYNYAIFPINLWYEKFGYNFDILDGYYKGPGKSMRGLKQWLKEEFRINYKMPYDDVLIKITNIIAAKILEESS